MYTRLELSSNFSATPRRLIQYRTVYRPSYRSLNKIDRGAIVETKELALEMIETSGYRYVYFPLSGMAATIGMEGWKVAIAMPSRRVSTSMVVGSRSSAILSSRWNGSNGLKSFGGIARVSCGFFHWERIFEKNFIRTRAWTKLKGGRGKVWMDEREKDIYVYIYWRGKEFARGMDTY